VLPKNRCPTFPGTILQEEFLKPLGLTPLQLAQRLGGDWSELQISAFIKGKICLAEDEMVALAAMIGGSLQLWMRLEQAWKDSDRIEKQNEKGSPKPWKKAL